jgi:choline kinase
MLRSAGIEEIHVVTGHQAQLVEHRLGDTVICCFNPFFRVAGILGSFWQVMPMFDGRPFVFTFSDHFFRPSLLLRCLSLDADLVILIQKKAAYTREDSKALIEGESVRFGKDIPLHEANGEYTGLTVLSARGSAAFFDQMRRLLKDGHLDAYAMDVLNAVTDRSDISVSLVYCDESSRIEIDTVADLRRARQMAGHILKERG